MKYCCSQCKKCWNHPIDRCIFCGQEIDQIQETKYHVIGNSEIFVPSTGNEKVPYHVNILQDNSGQTIIRKSFKKYDIGDTIDLQEDTQQNKQIGIIGTGLLGIQIAAYMIQYGYPTILKTRSDESKKVAFSKIQKQISKKMSDNEAEKTLKHLVLTTKYADLVHCDIVIEAAAEDITIKKEIFQELSAACGPSTIFATNSSSLSIDDLAKETEKPEMCIGMHFFNPVHRMDLVEIITGVSTSEATKETITNLVTRLNKKPILVKNSPGYIVNRLLLPQINEAIHLLESGIATKEDIDSAVKLGLNHPMGPFELADFIGLDICLSILEELSLSLKNDYYKPSRKLIELVEEKKLGYKSRVGFYEY
jgi:3-hydroxybutyryl-CoA dehydrogenase